MTLWPEFIKLFCSRGLGYGSFKNKECKFFQKFKIEIQKDAPENCSCYLSWSYIQNSGFVDLSQLFGVFMKTSDVYLHYNGVNNLSIIEYCKYVFKKPIFYRIKVTIIIMIIIMIITIVIIIILILIILLLIIINTYNNKNNNNSNSPPNRTEIPSWCPVGLNPSSW